MGNSYIEFPDQARHHLMQDPVMADLILRIDARFPAQSAETDVYTSLLRAIIGQQLSTKAASTIRDRFLNLFEDAQPKPQRVLETNLDTLRQVGLSNQKATYVKAVATYFTQHAQTNWAQTSDDEIIRELTAIKGVGTWTVQMILMFTLHRPDVFPIDDLAIQQAIQQLYQLPNEKKALRQTMQATAAPWQPWRCYACYYLWSSRDMKNIAG